MNKSPKDLEELEEKIKNFKKKISKPALSPDNNNKLKNLAIDFIVMVLVSGLIGYFIDQWLKSAPIFLLISLLFGFISGIGQIYKKIKDYV